MDLLTNILAGICFGDGWIGDKSGGGRGRGGRHSAVELGAEDGEVRFYITVL